MKVLKVNNHFFRVLKDGRKKRITARVYFKHSDKDIIRKKTVTFNLKQNEVRTYNLTNEEKHDKMMACRRIE